jgi:uncharacterized circularly permuted ATP-grasp superfamily protein
VLLTPGQFNSAYFEHAFLADEMGIELVEGRDLFVDESDVSTCARRAGPQRVDVIYRRVDDAFLDPLAFRPDSCSALPACSSPCRAGRVNIVNALGNGVADDKSTYTYVPEMVKLLPRRGADPEERADLALRPGRRLQYVLEHLSELVVKEVHGSGGKGMLVGPTSSKAEIEEFRGAPEGTRTTTSPSRRWRCPPARPSSSQGVAPRHVDLRPFVLTRQRRSVIVPGGLTRVALKEGSLVVNSSQGGGTKDTWVLAPDQADDR